MKQSKGLNGDLKHEHKKPTNSTTMGPTTYMYINIGIKHGFSCINVRQVPWEVLKTEAEGRGFQHLPRGPGEY